MYKVYLVRPNLTYEGFALIAAEDAANANEIIADFKEKDYDNGYNSYGYCYVGEDSVIKELSADRKGFILQKIHIDIHKKF